MFNLAVVTVSTFNGNGGRLDKNSKPSVILSPIYGVVPNRQVISGTVAEQSGLEAGNTYLVKIVEREESEEYGRQFNFLKMGTLDAMQLFGIGSSMPAGTLVDVDSDTVVDPTEDGDASDAKSAKGSKKNPVAAK